MVYRYLSVGLTSADSELSKHAVLTVCKSLNIYLYTQSNIYQLLMKYVYTPEMPTQVAVEPFIFAQEPYQFVQESFMTRRSALYMRVGIP